MSTEIEQTCKTLFLPEKGIISKSAQDYYKKCVSDRNTREKNEQLQKKPTPSQINEKKQQEKDKSFERASDNIKAIPSNIGNALWSPVSGIYTVGKAVGQTIGEGTSNAINATGTGIYNLSGNKTKKQIQEELIEIEKELIKSSNERDRDCVIIVPGYGPIVREDCKHNPIIKEYCKQLKDCQTRACTDLNDECPIQNENELKKNIKIHKDNCLENGVADEDCDYTPIIEKYTPIIEKNCKKLQDCQTPVCQELNDECQTQSEGGKKTRKHKKSKKTMKKSRKHRKNSRKHRKTKSV